MVRKLSDVAEIAEAEEFVSPYRFSAPDLPVGNDQQILAVAARDTSITHGFRQLAAEIIALLNGEGRPKPKVR
jgi:hypothetical protein